MNDIASAIDELAARVTAQERRLVVQMIECWRAAAGEARFPAWTAFDPADLGDKRRHCYFLDLADGRDDPTLVQVGDALIADCGRDPTGGPVSAVPGPTLLSESLQHFPLALDRQAPVSLGGMFAHADGRQVLFRSVILPLAGDGDEIVGFLGAANHRTVKVD